MKRIYIVLTYSGTILSKIIKKYTKAEYSHVSIGLDEKLDEMYSFGRLNAYNPFIGGFIHEGINIGTFKRFKKTQTAIYSMIITDEQYAKIIAKIKEMIKSGEKYRFNFIGLVAVALHRKIHRKHAFYCAEFVKYLFENAEVKNNLPEIIRPEDFLHIENITLEYKGYLQRYAPNKKMISA